MKLAIAINKVKLELRIWQPNICLKWPGFQISLYFCPVLCGSGTTKLSRIIHWWGQRSAYFRSGFVFRFLWFGFILRYGKVVQKKKKLWDHQKTDSWFDDYVPDIDTYRPSYLTGLDEADTY